MTVGRERRVRSKPASLRSRRSSGLLLLAGALRSGRGGGVFLFVRVFLAGFGQRLAKRLQLVLRLVGLVGDLGGRGAEAVEQRVDAVGIGLVAFELLAQRTEIAKDSLGARGIDLGQRSLPTALSFVGSPYAESTLIAAANAYQARTDWHLRRPI